MNGKLASFLAEAAGKRIVLGQWDCGLWLADWVMAATGGPDPAASLRGIGTNNPLYIRSVAREHNWPRTRTPGRGDIGLVSLQKGHLVGGIFTGTHWCVLIDEQGIGAIVPEGVRYLAAWSCLKP